MQVGSRRRGGRGAGGGGGTGRAGRAPTLGCTPWTLRSWPGLKPPDTPLQGDATLSRPQVRLRSLSLLVTRDGTLQGTTVGGRARQGGVARGRLLLGGTGRWPSPCKGPFCVTDEMRGQQRARNRGPARLALPTPHPYLKLENPKGTSFECREGSVRVAPCEAPARWAAGPGARHPQSTQGAPLTHRRVRGRTSRRERARGCGFAAAHARTRSRRVCLCAVLLTS